MKKLSICIAILFCQSLFAEPLQITYIERPPYYYKDNDEHKGILNDLTKKIFEHAKVDYKLRSLPTKRLMIYLKNAPEPMCSPGWFKNIDREKFAKFTQPFYRNAPMVALTVLSKENEISKHKTLTDLFQNKQLTLGTNELWSYGVYIDNLIKTQKPSIKKTAQTSDFFVKYLGVTTSPAGDNYTIDYMLIVPEEFEYIIKQANRNPADYVTIKFSDSVPGNDRHIMCNQHVSNDIINQLNVSITALKLP